MTTNLKSKLFPYEYVGGGYFRRTGVPTMDPKNPKSFNNAKEDLDKLGEPLILRSGEAIDYLIEKFNESE